MADRLGSQLVLEATSRHPFIEAFYANTSKFAFETEVAFALLHYHQLHALENRTSMASDFSPVKDLVFAEMNLNEEEMTAFSYVYSHTISRVPIPDLVVFLKMDVEVLQRRAAARGRPYEMNLTTDYLERLDRAYMARLPDLGRVVEVLNVAVGESAEDVANEVMELVWNQHS